MGATFQSITENKLNLRWQLIKSTLTIKLIANPKPLSDDIPIIEPTTYPIAKLTRPTTNNDAIANVLTPPIFYVLSTQLKRIGPQSPAKIIACSNVLLIILFNTFMWFGSWLEAGFVLPPIILKNMIKVAIPNKNTDK